MGTIIHYAIVVTGYDNHISEAHAAAVSYGCNPTDITPVAVNGYRSFLVPPNGSKLGWPDQLAGKEARDMLVGFLDQHDRTDWVEVSYGPDAEGCFVERNNKTTEDS